MIGGADTVISRPPQAKAEDIAAFVLALTKMAWPHAVEVKGGEGLMGVLETFLFENDAACAGWEQVGASPMHDDKMIQVLVSDDTVTLVTALAPSRTYFLAQLHAQVFRSLDMMVKGQ
jgi:hypothetical protein